MDPNSNLKILFNFKFVYINWINQINSDLSEVEAVCISFALAKPDSLVKSTLDIVNKQIKVASICKITSMSALNSNAKLKKLMFCSIPRFSTYLLTKFV